MVLYHLIRTALYSVFLFCALMTFILAAALTGKFESDFNTSFHPGVELLVTGILSFIVLPLHFVVHRRTTTHVLATLWVELTVLGVLFLMYLGGSAATSDKIGGCSNAGGFDECGIAKGMEAFAYLAWLTLLALIILLVGTGFMEHNKGHTTVWTEQYAMTEKEGTAAPAAVAPPTTNA